ncbi:hypothetical protein [Acidisoma sp. S159]|uniref:hypothetical protein n=1 Tax=Acidisoma sp. S159 TaxID=1747225 RepID=UPI00131C4EB1|nr:hypothetical protein [Acidisoma sp. S159]
MFSRRMLIGSVSVSLLVRPLEAKADRVKSPPVVVHQHPTFSRDLVEAYDALGYDIEDAYQKFEQVRDAYLSKSPEKFCKVLAARFTMNLNGYSVIVLRGQVQPLIRYKSLLFNRFALKRIEEADFLSVEPSVDGLSLGHGDLWLTPQCLDDACARSSLSLTVFNLWSDK